MSDTESVVCLSESDDDEVRLIPQDDDFYDEEEEKISVKDIALTDKRGTIQPNVDADGIILQEESFVETKINREKCGPEKQDMTTQTDEGFAQNGLEKKDSESVVQSSSFGNTRVTLKEYKKNDGAEDAESKNSTDCYRSRNNSTTSYFNNGQQNNSSVNSGALARKNTQKVWNQTRNRAHPYNRPNYNFAHSYNYFGVPTPNYNNFARQILPVRERYIRQFKEHLRTSFEHFLNNTLPFSFPQGFNNNFPQGSSNNLSQDNNNFSQGINFSQGNPYQRN